MTLSERSRAAAATSRRIWALTTPYFGSDEKWRARGLLAAIVALNLGAVYLLVLINDWNRLFYDALQARDQPVFWQQLGRFTSLAFAYIVVAVYRFYLTQLLELRWRAWMTRHYLDRWLREHAFYRLELARFGADGAPPDNPDQRIQEDLNLFTTYSVSLSMGLLNAVVTLVSFVGILWTLSGSFGFTLGGTHHEVPGFMVWAAIAYCVAGSLITHYIGRPQIGLNFRQQRLEADFRHHMVRVREYSEAIALDRGELVEREQLGLRFSQVLVNYLALIRKQKNLTWFTTFFGQAAVVFPFLVAAPRFFSGAIQLGELMQISSAFGQVQESLAWFVDNYSSLAAWRATADRLTSFEESVAAQERQDTGLSVTAGDALSTAGLDLALPTGARLLAGLHLRVAAGDHVLLKGPSGSGKSTLFRAIAGIWPFARGHATRPADTMAIPQHPYFPDGSLRNALAYPEPAQRYPDEALRQALADALLPQLADRLDEEAAWGQRLSGGERQRLALARVFLKNPRWVLADEATAALDPPAEQVLYGRLLERIDRRGGGLVSIAHRPALEPFHNRRWELARRDDGDPAFALRQG
ncbi:MAG TPA: ABC transporter ATP-binding protein/permease [Ramlibacter sp.]|jgi:putative ATP-binding cassette transporter|uniref:ABC transporter ATP-binding protein/permease n=1 Tax=Ramlibacter sp. TaxID=1917967 RepID=UPI002D5791A9|nr:ABC transporter ATP-binding protein/permease [Ramlibacter sp.]HZY19736.1 ABC transporter ATP-binding protein/permease [Ramlibacter sp.]